jgi:hypothetical protein
MAKKEKPFDAIAASRRWRRETSRLVRDMTPEEQLAFFNRRLAGWPDKAKSRSSGRLAHG